jgi:hypothetical protein
MSNQKLRSNKIANKRVEFDAHKTVKKETEVMFTKKDGTKVDFEAKKPVKVPVHVEFTAHKRIGKLGLRAEPQDPVELMLDCADEGVRTYVSDY